MPFPPHRADALHHRFFLGPAAVRKGPLTTAHLRSSAWRRLFRGVYADADLPDSHHLRCAAASAYLLPGSAAIAGRSAATLYQAGLARATDPVEVLVPPEDQFGPRKGLVIHTGRVADGDIVRIGELRVTSPARTCWDLARWLDLPEAVALIDRMLAASRVTVADLRRYRAAKLEVRGAAQFTGALALVDARSGSPQESRLRVRLATAGVAPPATQFSVYLNGQFVARVDFAWPDLRIALEYDGLWHVGSAPQMHADRQRLNRLVSAGWLVLHLTSTRLRDDFDSFVVELRSAIRTRSRA